MGNSMQNCNPSSNLCAGMMNGSYSGINGNVDSNQPIITKHATSSRHIAKSQEEEDDSICQEETKSNTSINTYNLQIDLHIIQPLTPLADSPSPPPPQQAQQQSFCKISVLRQLENVNPKGNCPFGCGATNISFILFLHHCDSEHAQKGQAEHGWLANMWLQYNFASTQIRQFGITISPSTISCQSAEINNQQQQPAPKNTKKTTKFHNTDHINTYKYDPIQAQRVYRNIYIDRAFITKSQSSMNEKLSKLKCQKGHDSYCECNKLYSWLDIDIAIQYDNHYSDKTLKIYNHGCLDDTLNEDLFSVVIQPGDDKKMDDFDKNKRKKWPQMKEKLYTKQELVTEYKLDESRLPLPVRNTPRFRDELSQKEAIAAYLKNPSQLNKLIEANNWCHIDVFAALNNKRRTSLYITSFDFKMELRQNEIFEVKDFELIPIILFKNKHYSIHHVIIVKIHHSNVGISMIYDNSSNSIEITGIHIDRERICIQHQWTISLKHVQECNHVSLNKFVTNIDYMRIGNVDEDKNRIKALRKAAQSMKSENKDLQNKLKALKRIGSN